MNGVLAKPFTKEGMLKSIKTHLSHLLKNPPPADGSGAFIMPAITYIDGSTPVKLEQQTAGSANNWPNNSMPPNNSMSQNNGMAPNGLPPNGLPNDVDHSFGMVNGAPGYPMGGGNRPPPYGSGMDGSSGRMGADHDSPPEKRQRLNPPQGNFAQ